MHPIARLSPLCLAALALAAAPALAGGPHAPRRPSPANPEEIERMIDALASISRQDTGYSASVSGGGFAPLGRREPGAMLLGQEPSAESSTFTAIIAQGIAAAPTLLAHLGDARPSALPAIQHDMGMGGLFLDAEYDRNWRLTPAVPTGTCLRMQWAKDAKHTITVGDLCFVALGQIVNRRWNAVRYQPTACIMVSSPVRSPALRDAVLAEWGGLTEERHRASLAADARTPDRDARRQEALVRLAYYYPDAVTAPAVEALRLPVYDQGPAWAAAQKIQDELEDPARRREVRDAYVKAHGALGAEVLRAMLSERVSWPAQHDRQVRLLEQLYPGEDHEAPRWLDALTPHDLARLLDALSHARSPEIDAEAWRILRSLREPPFDDDAADFVALACVRRLRGEGGDAELRAYCEDPRSSGEDAKALRELAKTLR